MVAFCHCFSKAPKNGSQGKGFWWSVLGFMWGRIESSELSVREKRKNYWLSNYQDLLFRGVSYLIWSVKSAGFFSVLIAIYITACRKNNTPAFRWRQYPGNSRVSSLKRKGGHMCFEILYSDLWYIFFFPRYVDWRLIYLHYFWIIPSTKSQIKGSIPN